MKKKNLVVVVCLCLVLTLTGFSQAGNIKIALDSPPDMEKSGTYVWAKTFSDDLLSKGMKVELFPRESLGNEEEKLDQVSQGLLEISCSDLAKAGQLEATIQGFSLPFLFDNMAHLDRVIAGTDIMEKVNTGLGKKGIRVLSLIPVGTFSGLANTKRQVKTPLDVKGLSIRALDKAQAQYINAWGASTVIVTWAEIYNALQTGVANGYLNPAIVPVMFKHTEVLKYFSDIKINAPLRVSICSEQWYRGLNEKEKAVVADAVNKADMANRAWLAKMEKTDEDSLKASGVNFYKNTPEEIAQFAELSRKEYSKIVPVEIVDLFLNAAKAKR